MAALHFWRRQQSNRHSSSKLQPRHQRLSLRLEQLEDRVLLTKEGLFADGLYQVVLNRKPAAGEDAGWVAALQSGAISQGQAALGFMTSAEYDADRLGFFYQTLLGRAPEPA